jgi:dTDP-4-amino-4,6-dideoxygalactose transaminase
MLVSRHPELIEFARRFRNYGKPDYQVEGLNYRMSEFTAALGAVQVDRLEEIVAWKTRIATDVLDPQFPNRVRFPDGMASGYYKYIVFDPVERSSGKVYDRPCHVIMNRPGSFPNAQWIAQHHWCVPLYYHPEGLR